MKFTYEMFKRLTSNQELFSKTSNANKLLLFYESKKGIVKSEYNNKIVIPGEEMKDIKPGTLCYLWITKYKENIYKTLGEDSRSLLYWKNIFSFRENKALEIFQLASGIDGIVSNDIIRADCFIREKLLIDFDENIDIDNQIIKFYSIREDPTVELKNLNRTRIIYKN